MNDDAFLDAILANPADDGPRLAYADWLEGRGDPRAEFIRVQCRLENMLADHPERAQLKASEQELLSVHAATWLGSLKTILKDWQFRRGFVEQITVDVRVFLTHGAELCRSAPISIVRFKLDEAHGEETDGQLAGLTEQLAGCANLSRLTHLNLAWLNLQEEGVRNLLASRFLTNISYLAFGDSDSSLATARTLAESPNLPRLAELYFCGDYESDLGDEGLKALASAPSLSGLTTLHLNNNNIRSAGAEALATSRYLTRLQHLYLGNGSYNANTIGPQGMRALAASANLANLITLGLPFNLIQDDGLKALAESPHLRQLTSLDLRGNDIGDTGALALADSPNFRSVTFLDLQHNAVGPPGFQALAGSANWGELHTLSLQGNNIGDAGLEALAASGNLRSLKHLDVRRNTIGDKGVQALAASAFATGLKSIWLYENRLGSEGVKAIAASPFLAGLADLGLSSNPIDAAGLEALIETTHLTSLQQLTLHGISIPDDLQAKLRNRYGDRLRCAGTVHGLHPLLGQRVEEL